MKRVTDDHFPAMEEAIGTAGACRVFGESRATVYRLLRERGQADERRAQAAHPAKKKPELMADGPNQVWSWDITKLKGPARGIWFQLYVIIDIYSRKVIHWEAWPTETGILAREILGNDGFASFSIEAVAPRAGVGRPAVYRRWPSKIERAVEAVASPRPSGSLVPVTRWPSFVPWSPISSRISPTQPLVGR